jgi:hypothetical protein
MCWPSFPPPGKRVIPLSVTDFGSSLPNGKTSCLRNESNAGKLKAGRVFQAGRDCRPSYTIDIEQSFTGKDRPPSPMRSSRVLVRHEHTARFIEPMECLPVEEIPEGDVWTYELKLDGYRLLTVKTGGKVTLYSRVELTSQNALKRGCRSGELAR